MDTGFEDSLGSLKENTKNSRVYESDISKIPGCPGISNSSRRRIS
jgi:hypothetical protein